MKSDTKRNKVLVVGAGGFLGTSLSHILLEHGDDVSLVSRKPITTSKATVLCGDVTDKEFSKKILSDIDVVYYLAGFRKNIAVHTKQPFTALAGNVSPFLNFLVVLRDTKVKTCVYVSSTIVEYFSAETSVIDGYVWGKYVNELIAKTFSKETGIQIKIVRAAAIYGPGCSFETETANFIPSLIKKIDEAKDEIVVWGTGKRKLQFVHVDDLSRNIIAASKEEGNFFTFGNPETVSVDDVVEMIMEGMGKKLPIAHDESKPDKATELAKFENLVAPEYDLRKGIKETINYYKIGNV